MMKLKANYIDIINKTIFPAEITIDNATIVAISKIEESLSTYVLPGFIDAHIHIESSMLIPSEFARIAVNHGTVATLSDPHEIANVLGVKGVEFMLANAEKTNFHFYFGVSPCVPATPFETSGAVLDANTVKELLQHPKLNYLAEVMAFPSVIHGDEEIMAKIQHAKELQLPIDGHAPMLRGDDLQKYIDAGISTDHEASSYEEAKEKLERGMKILIREGSAAQNYEALAPLIQEYSDSLMFCSDDKHPNDLLHGHINTLVVRSLKKGYDLFDVLKIACINPKEHYNLDVGQLRVGDKADFIEVSDIENFHLLRTFINGVVVSKDGTSQLKSIEEKPLNNFHTHPKKISDFAFESNCKTIEVIQAIDHELLTLEKQYHPHTKKLFHANIKEDILKITVVNRYEDTQPAVSFVNGFGLKKGAIASSIAHDSHNIIAVGCSDEAIQKAVNLLIESKGGISALSEDTTLHLPLEVGGIMSHHDAFDVASRYEEIDKFVKEHLHTTLSAPFMTLSFMALLVIPEIKLSDKGLFDAKAFHFISRCVH